MAETTANPTLDALQQANPTCLEWQSRIEARKLQGAAAFTSPDELLQAFEDYRLFVHSNPFPRIKTFATTTKNVDYPRMMTVQSFRSYLKLSPKTWAAWTNDPQHTLHAAACEINNAINAHALELASQEAVPQHLVIRMLGAEMADHSNTEINASMDRAPKHPFRSILRGLDAQLKDAEESIDDPSGKD